jgi:hypothetical protein
MASPSSVFQLLDNSCDATRPATLTIFAAGQADHGSFHLFAFACNLLHRSRAVLEPVRTFS